MTTLIFTSTATYIWSTTRTSIMNLAGNFCYLQLDIFPADGHLFKFAINGRHNYLTLVLA